MSTYFVATPSISDASQVTYTPAVPGDWSPPPVQVAEALDQIAAGGVSGGPDNFSYDYIDTAVTVTIPLYQQMIVSGSLVVIGTLIMNGTVVII